MVEKGSKTKEKFTTGGKNPHFNKKYHVGLRIEREFVYYEKEVTVEKILLSEIEQSL